MITQYGEIMVKEYTALITQFSTDPPVATIMKNTIGNIVWTRHETGEYRGTLTGAFLENKTVASIQPTTEYHPNIELYVGPVSTNIITILAYESGTLSDSVLFAFLTIKIYTYV